MTVRSRNFARLANSGYFGQTQKQSPRIKSRWQRYFFRSYGGISVQNAQTQMSMEFLPSNVKFFFHLRQSKYTTEIYCLEQPLFSFPILLLFSLRSPKSCKHSADCVQFLQSILILIEIISLMWLWSVWTYICKC